MSGAGGGAGLAGQGPGWGSAWAACPGHAVSAAGAGGVPASGPHAGPVLGPSAGTRSRCPDPGGHRCRAVSSTALPPLVPVMDGGRLEWTSMSQTLLGALCMWPPAPVSGPRPLDTKAVRLPFPEVETEPIEICPLAQAIRGPHPCSSPRVPAARAPAALTVPPLPFSRRPLEPLVPVVSLHGHLRRRHPGADARLQQPRAAARRPGLRGGRPRAADVQPEELPHRWVAPARPPPAATGACPVATAPSF